MGADLVELPGEPGAQLIHRRVAFCLVKNQSLLERQLSLVRNDSGCVIKKRATTLPIESRP